MEIVLRLQHLLAALQELIMLLTILSIALLEKVRLLRSGSASAPLIA